MGGYATRVNRFLSLTLSLMTTITPWVPRASPLFPTCPLPWLVAGDGQHECWKKRASSERIGSGSGSGNAEKEIDNDRTTLKEPEKPKKGLPS